MRHRRLTQGTRVRVGSILIIETFGNMKITTTRVTSNAITIEQADIDDLALSLNRHLAEGISAHVGSILIAQASGNLKISTVLIRLSPKGHTTQ